MGRKTKKGERWPACDECRIVGQLVGGHVLACRAGHESTADLRNWLEKALAQEERPQVTLEHAFWDLITSSDPQAQWMVWHTPCWVREHRQD